MNTEKAFKWIIWLSAVGIVLASYLLSEYLAEDPLELCSINARINCGPVTKGNLAEFYGIPVSVIGLIGYIVILFSALTKKTKWLLGMTAFGMLFCLRLTILEIFVENIICPVCVLCQTIMLVVFILSLKLNFGKKLTPR
ncbi:MAG: vitamin K epoxide reductase family protein [Candidatus Roizmanbacteria bacterium]|nr:vitamin K epoxide reductase family protein [Candidatus Roizmanbacteria bacterium]